MDYLAQRLKVAAIGCSFTNYIWPTYADVLQADKFGQAGIGNERIFYILCHLYKTQQLYLYDAIIIQWTGPFRFDYLKKDGWTHNDGNIAHSVENRYIWKKIKEWYNEDFETEKSKNYILATKAICDKIGIKQYHMSMTDFIDYVDLPELSDNFKGRYQIQRAKWSKTPFEDGHPDILSHISIAEKAAEYLQTNISPIMTNKCNDFHKQILKGMTFEDIDNDYKLYFPNRHITAC